MSGVVARSGILSHLVGDANNPFHIGDDDAEERVDFEQYFERGWRASRRLLRPRSQLRAQQLSRPDLRAHDGVHAADGRGVRARNARDIRRSLDCVRRRLGLLLARDHRHGEPLLLHLEDGRRQRARAERPCMRIERAILSVSDKTGIVELARALRAKRRRDPLHRRNREASRRQRHRRHADRAMVRRARNPRRPREDADAARLRRDPLRPRQRSRIAPTSSASASRRSISSSSTSIRSKRRSPRKA